ncbi:Ankyrin repeat-containing domain [Pseudocohnilembus persalinus]|uniref:Ankyrin repeat-containing domain n=1 Tax=Pseudocohnilembus persalinus TaxID=266149 RepID=A0A0V0QT06_PSEPJ|nr:Ankyrin repeat-containing domain [Pseudocohnilembus persalinus]|eukprot:KRX05420.1 Ankyrin repeat-containing domain [Pseudocohnilembus persalinus]
MQNKQDNQEQQQQQQMEDKFQQLEFTKEEEQKLKEEIEEQQSQQGDCYESNEEFFLDSVRLGDIEDVKDVMKDNIDVAWFDKNLNNALHMIAGNGHIELFNIIFDYIKQNNWEQEKINKFINQQNADGQTPVHFGTICGQKEIVQLLCEKGANCNVTNQVGNTPIEEALALEQYEIGEILAKYTKEDLEKYQNVENYQVQASKQDTEEMVEEEQKANNQDSSKN